MNSRLMAIAAAFLIMFAPAAARCDECTDYTGYMRQIGAVFSPTTPYDFEYRDGFIYACTWHGFAVYDVRDRANMSLVGNLDFYGWTESVELVGNTAYVMTRDVGLCRIDITDPSAPRLVSSHRERGDLGSSVLVDGIIFYHPAGEILAFDTAQGRYVGRRYHQYAGTNTIAAMEGRLLVGADQTLTVHDSSDPTSMREMSRYQAPGWIWGFWVCGDVVYVACDDAGIVELEITVDGAIRELRRIDAGLAVRKVQVDPPWLYAMTNSSVNTIDLRDTGAPVVRGKVGTEGVSTRFHVLDNTAFVARVSGILAIDVTNPYNAPLLAGMSIPGSDDVAVRGNYAYYACASQGGWMASLADAEHPVALGRIGGLPPAIRWVGGVEVRGNLLYAATGYDHCLAVLDITDPAHPRTLGALPGPGLTYDLAVAGSIAYVASNVAGLRVVDVSDPAQPRLLQTLMAGEAVWKLELAGDHLFVITGSGSIWFIDVSDPAAPGVPRELPDFRYAKHIRVHGNIGYVVFSGRVDMYDLTNIDSLVQVGRISVRNSGGFSGVPGIAVDGRICYVSLGGAVQVFDITDRAHPVFIQYIYTPGFTRNVAIIGDYLHFLCDTGGVQVAARQCVEPFIVPVDFRPGSAENRLNCAAANGVLPVAILGTEALPVGRIDDRSVRCGPGSAAEAHANRFGPVRHEQDVDGDGLVDLLFHFRLGETGIQCTDTKLTLTGETHDGMGFIGTDVICPVHEADKEPATPPGIAISPNPFNPRATIAFSLQHAGHVRIAVYDIRGRLVVTVADGTFAVGAHTVAWAGRDADGKDAPSGEYFFRILGDGIEETRKATLLR